MTGSGGVRAEAFAPAHVTGVFAPAVDARDPRGRGSTGAGIVLELGVRAVAEFRPGPRNRLTIESDLGRPLPISEEVARRLRPRSVGALHVRLTHPLPVGQGFGLSAAGATATALAVGALSHRPRSESVVVAHLADLFGGGGLGGVASIVGGGGLEFRVRAGVPPYGRVVHRPWAGTVLVGVLGGPLPSPRLLRSPRFLERVKVASEGLDALLARPSPARFFALSEQFTDRLRLAPDPLVRLMHGMRRRGAWAAQSMFGRSFVACPRNREGRRAVVRWLESRGVRAVEISTSRHGARLVRPSLSAPER